MGIGFASNPCSKIAAYRASKAWRCSGVKTFIFSWCEFYEVRLWIFSSGLDWSHENTTQNLNGEYVLYFNSYSVF
jgi:hypothetical protein